MCFHLGKNIEVQVRMCQVQVSSPDRCAKSKFKSIGRKSKSHKTGLESDSSPSPGLEYYISGIAVEISLLSCIEAEIYAMLFLLLVNGRHL